MLTMEMVLHKDVDFAPKFGKNPIRLPNLLTPLSPRANTLCIIG